MGCFKPADSLTSWVFPPGLWSTRILLAWQGRFYSETGAYNTHVLTLKLTQHLTAKSNVFFNKERSWQLYWVVLNTVWLWNCIQILIRIVRWEDLFCMTTGTGKEMFVVLFLIYTKCEIVIQLYNGKLCFCYWCC